MTIKGWIRSFRSLRIGSLLGLIALVSVWTVIGIQAPPGSPKSLYLIADHHTAQFDAWQINPEDGKVTYQATYPLEHATNPSGIAIDIERTEEGDIVSATLFVSTEGSNIVELVDAITMKPIGTASAIGATELAGIDIDQGNNLVYAVERASKKLYVYKWDPSSKTLSLMEGYPVALSGCQQAFGIALDASQKPQILWVADADAGIARAYNVDTWAEDTSKSFKPSHQPVDIAVDTKRGFVYTVSMSARAENMPTSGSNLLSKYDLRSQVETTTNLGTQGVGVAVDEDTGLVYVTLSPHDPRSQAGRLSIWDTSTSSWSRSQEIEVSGSPAGILIGGGYNPLDLEMIHSFALIKCVNPGKLITYTLCYDNARNDMAVHNVTLVDALPIEASFTEATGGGDYNADDHIVTWKVEELQARAPKDCVKLTVQIAPSTPRGAVITNRATITSQETGPTEIYSDVNVCNDTCSLVAKFDFDPVEITTQDTVHFSNQSIDTSGYIVYWGWDFGDGIVCPKEPASCGTGTNQNPTHRYSTVGNYIVELTIVNNHGCIAKTRRLIQVQNNS